MLKMEEIQLDLTKKFKLRKIDWYVVILIIILSIHITMSVCFAAIQLIGKGPSASLSQSFLGAHNSTLLFRQSARKLTATVPVISISNHFLQRLQPRTWRITWTLSWKPSLSAHLPLWPGTTLKGTQKTTLFLANDGSPCFLHWIQPWIEVPVARPNTRFLIVVLRVRLHQPTRTPGF
ncbi:hypothetical protein CSKR_104182 [Clonorchis sinensis]|uniref:Uncharacterized protein n=1 Tax=Clonorchis sinensis TaxID=79923 RepID=A0A3R7C811_CLOSI|nr:hypothetical protein CSKR_104182 [Clonorchis sinensis]